MKTVKALLKSRRGVTLTELLVTLAILAILLPSITVALFSVWDSFSRTKNMADLNILSANLENSITNQLAYGYNAQVLSDAKSTNYIQFEKYGSESVRLDTRIPEDENISVLYMNGRPLYDVSYYNGISTSALFEENDNLITVTLNFSGRIDYTTNFTVKPLS